MPFSYLPARSPLSTVCLIVLLILLAPRPGRAETTTAYKYQDYQESGGRISVRAHYALVEQTIGTETVIKITGVIDTIAGATPTGEPADPLTDQVPLAQIDDRRKAWSADFARQFGRVNLAVGAANSRENDYVSTGFSLNTLTDFNTKNTTLLVGLAATDDDVKVFFQPTTESKQTFDLIVGVTQLLDPQTSVVFNVTYGSASGYLSDPYKLIRKNTELLPGIFLPLTFPENRPDEREKWIGYTTLNHTSEKLRGAIEATYRLYHDSFGITSHTLGVTWLQRLGEHVILAPNLRFYHQGAADFYLISLDGTPIIPTVRPNPAGKFYSADYRLSEFVSWTYGVKLVWTPRPSFQADLSWEEYRMDGRDRLTSASAYPNASIVTVGLRYVW